MIRLATALAVTCVASLAAAAPAHAQQEAECPAVEEGQAMPLEVRIAGIVLRAHVNADVGEGSDSTRVEARFVRCEDRAARAADETAAPGTEPAAASGLLRLLNDLRFGIDMVPGDDGRCFRARLDVRDAAAAARGDAAGTPGRAPAEPIAIEFCGLPVGRTAPGTPRT